MMSSRLQLVKDNSNQFHSESDTRIIPKETVIILTASPEIFREYFKRTLNERIFVFNNVSEALEFWNQHQSCFVFADYATIKGSTKSGFMLAREMREHNKDTAIFLMSSEPTVHDSFWARGRGANGLIAKTPLAIEETLTKGGMKINNFTPLLLERIENINTLLSRFLTTQISTIVIEKVNACFMGSQEQTIEHYIDLLSKEVPGEVKRLNFIEAAHTLLKKKATDLKFRELNNLTWSLEVELIQTTFKDFAGPIARMAIEKTDQDVLSSHKTFSAKEYARLLGANLHSDARKIAFLNAVDEKLRKSR